MDKQYLVGFDPSFINLGVCIYEPKAKTMKLYTGDFQSAVAWVGTQVKLGNIIAVVENPNLDSTTFKMWGLVEECVKNYVRTELNKFIGKPGPQTKISDVQSQFSIAMNYAQKVGQNKAAAKLLLKLLSDKRVPTIEFAPSERNRADKKDKRGNLKYKDVRLLSMPTKTTQDQFHDLTGYSIPSSEHARDAATLVWGRTMKWAELQLAVKAAETKNRPDSYPGNRNNNYYLFSSSANG